MEMTVATDQPMGQAHQMPVEPKAVPDRTKASTTRRIRSVKVAPADITEKLRSTPLADVQEVAVCGGAYRSLTGCKVTLEALSGYSLISLGEHGSTYRLYRQFFADHHVPFEPDIEAATADQILPMVKANLGIGFVPATFLSEADWGQSIYPIDLVQKLPPRKVCLVESAQYSAAAAAKELKNICFAHSTAVDLFP